MVRKVGSDLYCGTGEPETQNKTTAYKSLTADDPYGRYLVANGTLKVLVVFVRFPDDNTTHNHWTNPSPTWFPAMTDEFIDATVSEGSTNYVNITNYFDQMSIGNFKLIGDVVKVTAPKPSTHPDYQKPGSYIKRAEATIDVLNHIDTTTSINYSDYDNWKNISEYSNENVSDGVVDMILMIWKGGGWFGNWTGEASLGYGSTITLDGVDIKFGYGSGSIGSGVTIHDNSNATRTLASVKHELGHWLLGGNSQHPYSNELYTNTIVDNRISSILQGGAAYAISANAYEREKLGWITVDEITSSRTDTLDDFITMGDALKYKVPSGGTNEYYYITNNQKLSIYDEFTKNSSDKGIFINHVKNILVPSQGTRYLLSDGDWEWANVSPYTTNGPCCGTVPVFGKIEPAPENGVNYSTEMWADNYDGGLHWPHGYKDENGNVKLGGYYRGDDNFDMNGTYNMNHRQLFAPVTNPKPQSWSGTDNSFALKVIGKSGDVLYLDFFTNYNPYSITENTTWDGQIFLDDNVTVQSGKTLTIKPNTTVYVANGKSISVNGILDADRVIFTAMDSNWGGVKFNSGSKGSLTDVVINNAKSYGGAAIYISNTDESFLIKNSTIKNCARACGGVYINNSGRAYIQNTHFENNTNDAITVSNYSNAYIYSKILLI